MAEMKSTRYDCLLKVLVVGDPFVGKSSLLLQYVDGFIPLTCKSTIGGDFKLKNINFQQKLVKLQIWDTAGQERNGLLPKHFFRNAQIVFLVFDVSDRKSYQGAKMWAKEVQENVGDSYALMLVGNKTDLWMERSVSPEEGDYLAQSLGCRYMECSALTGDNVEQVFIEGVMRLLKGPEVAEMPSHWSMPFHPDSTVNEGGIGRANEVKSLLVPPTPKQIMRHQSIRLNKEKKCC